MIKDIVQPSPEEIDLENRVAEFRRRIALADGQLIPLNKRSREDELLQATARLVPSDRFERKANYQSATYPVLLIDVYAGNNHLIHPVGYFDWALKGDRAVAESSHHFVAQPTNYHEHLADFRWKQGGSIILGVNIDYRYQQQGIGTFMFSSALTVLQQQGATSVSLIDTASEGARSMYARFGIVDPTVINMPISELIAHPQCERSIREFV